MYTLWRCPGWLTSHYGPTAVGSGTEIPCTISHFNLIHRLLWHSGIASKLLLVLGLCCTFWLGLHMLARVKLFSLQEKTTCSFTPSLPTNSHVWLALTLTDYPLTCLQLTTRILPWPPPHDPDATFLWELFPLWDRGRRPVAVTRHAAFYGILQSLGGQ